MDCDFTISVSGFVSLFTLALCLFLSFFLFLLLAAFVRFDQSCRWRTVSGRAPVDQMGVCSWISVGVNLGITNHRPTNHPFVPSYCARRDGRVGGSCTCEHLAERVDPHRPVLSPRGKLYLKLDGEGKQASKLASWRTMLAWRRCVVWSMLFRCAIFSLSVCSSSDLVRHFLFTVHCFIVLINL